MIASIAIMTGPTPAALAKPRLPEHGFVVFASNRSGAWAIWRMGPDGTNARRISGRDHEAVMPTISPDGKWVAYRQGNASTARDIWLLRADGSDARCAVHDPDITHLPIAPAWGTEGFYYQKARRIYHLDPQTLTSTPVHDLDEFAGMKGSSFNFHGLTRDRRWIVGHSNRYRGGFTGANGTFKSGNSAIALDSHRKQKVYFLGHGCEPTTAPMQHVIYHVNGAKWPETDIYIQHLDRIADRSGYSAEVAYPDKQWGHEYFPRVSNNARWLIYGASQGDHNHYGAPYEIFIHRIGDPRTRTRLTNNPATDNWPHVWIGECEDQAPAARVREQQAPKRIRVNAGGGALQGWQAQHRFVDAHSGDYTTSNPVIIPGDLAAAAPREVYKTCRHRNPIFTFPGADVPPGRYRVVLHFTEPHFASCEQARRRMKISINERTVEERFNPCAAAGACGKACAVEYAVDVQNDTGLRIAFDGGGRDGFVMGIDIAPVQHRRAPGE